MPRGLAGIAHDDAAQHQRPAGAGRQALGLFQQQSGHAAADGAAADQGDAERFRHAAIIAKTNGGYRYSYPVQYEGESGTAYLLF